MNVMIETIDLTKKFGDFIANDHINLKIKANEIKCIVGENGAGKSTLMNMLYGLLAPDEGEIRIKGKSQKFKSPIDAIENGIGMVHQHFKLVQSLSVYENILLGLEIEYTRGKIPIPLVNRKLEIQKIKDLIEKNGFDLNPLDKVENLSVGAKQRVEILKMLYRDVDILILDEPTAVLTPCEVDGLLSTLKRLKELGKTIILITHKLREVMEIADGIAIIRQGKLIGDFPVHEIDEKQIAQYMVGRDVLFSIQNDETIADYNDPIYEVNHISTVNDYGKEIDVSFQAFKGEVLGIAGIEGNGQSELVKILTGLMSSTKGSIRFKGQEITNMWPYQLRDLGIGIIPEDRYAQGLCKTMTISENAIAGYHKRKDICTLGMYHMPKVLERRNQFIQDFDIRLGDVNGNIGSLSGGNAQKMIIARELYAKPTLLIACQPTRGVDIGSIEFIHKEILKFKNLGNTVILISSELSEIMSLSDRILVMYKGKLLGQEIGHKLSIEEVGMLMNGIMETEENNV